MGHECIHERVLFVRAGVFAGAHHRAETFAKGMDLGDGVSGS